MRINSEPIGVGKEFLNEIFEARIALRNERKNIKIIEEMFPNEDISQVLKKLGITNSELKTEFQLKEKIRDWKIKSIS
jgi:DNA-directed RNA polymerase specialized sigma54-like protein